MPKMVFLYIGVIFVIVLLLIYYGSQWKYDYWKKQKVPGPKPVPIFGNYKDFILMKKFIAINVDEICKQFPNEPYIGVYYGSDPTLIVQDPEILKLILTKDFYYFNGREITNHSDKEIITQNMFFTYGDRWRVVRQNLTPMFSSLKMKNMFHLIQKCCFDLEKVIDKETKISEVLEVKSLMARYTIDCIGTCAFGVDTNVLGDEKDNPFKRMGDNLFDDSLYGGLRLIGRVVWPAIFYALGFKMFPQFINDFFKKLITGVFEKRQYKPSERNDFVDLVLHFKTQTYMTGDAITNMKSNESKKINLKVDDDFLIIQCILFFASGFETSSTILSFIFYELAKKPEAQEKAFNDIMKYLEKNDNKISYSCMTELPYLEACINETLRFYPVAGNLTREVMEDYTLPTGVFLKKGTRIHIPIYNLQRKEEFFPNPLEYEPERFLGKRKRKIKPYTYIPFGEGPRICIALRFAKMQMLAGLITVLKKYKLELADDMPSQVEFQPKSFVTQPIGGVKLRCIPRDGWEGRVYNK